MDGAARQRKPRAMNRPWMPLYVGDYLGDTGHLTTTQHGAYLLLMMHYWRKGELPDDDRQLSKITKLPLKIWCDCRPTLQDFFHEGWKHKRIDAELAKMVRVSEKRAIAGQKGGLGSALARMKLENASRSRQALSREVLSREVLPRAIAASSSSVAAAAADHSHSNSHQSLLGDESPGQTRPADPSPSPPPSGGRREKPAISVSPELAAYVARRTT
jgi:uncharacterized protein YdaU (DUF1376 family)